MTKKNKGKLVVEVVNRPGKQAKQGKPTCKACGFRIRGPHHDEGLHHKQGRGGYGRK